MTTVAFFDLDYTLIDASSGIIYVKEAIFNGRIMPWVAGYISVGHRLGLIDFGEAHGRLIKRVGRQGRQAALDFFREQVTPKVLPRITKAGLAKIDWHREQGHRVVIISASIEELVQPVAEHLGVEFLCTRLAIEDGVYTGDLDGPMCYGQGKVYWAREWLREQNLPFPEAIGYFYTDSSSDVPLLEITRHPVAVNPSTKLARIATERGWPVEKFY